MKNKFLYILVLFCLITVSCEIDEQVDPNAPSLNSVAENATPQELNLLVNGILASMRTGYGEYVTGPGSIAREMYRFDADPRNTEDLLGKDGVGLDNNTFYLTSPYNSRYRVIKTANVLLDALNNTTSVTEAEKEGYRGFARTIQGLMYTQVLNMLGSNGIRFDVSDPEILGPFLSEAEGWQRIQVLFDQAADHLNGASFAFTLNDGWSGFSDPAGFLQVNRALAARALARAGLYEAVEGTLSSSFYDLNGNLTTGPKMVFSLSSGDIQNPVFRVPNENGNQLVVHNRFIEDAISGDSRLGKFSARAIPTSLDSLNGTHQTALYPSNVSPIDIIRNEELIFIYAEAQMNLNNAGNFVTAMNVIRQANGLDDYSGGTSMEEMIDEYLFQRGYSFWGEAKLMFDLRTYGRLNDANLPIDRPGDIIHTQFPIPLAENQ